MTEDFIDTIIDRWRGATMSKQTALDGSADLESLVRDEFSSLSPQAPVLPQAPTIQPQAPAAAPPVDPDRFRLLKKPLESPSTLRRGNDAPPPPPPGLRR